MRINCTIENHDEFTILTKEASRPAIWHTARNSARIGRTNSFDEKDYHFMVLDPIRLRMMYQ